jgi:hypothetical protein
LQDGVLYTWTNTSVFTQGQKFIWQSPHGDYRTYIVRTGQTLNAGETPYTNPEKVNPLSEISFNVVAGRFPTQIIGGNVIGNNKIFGVRSNTQYQINAIPDVDEVATLNPAATGTVQASIYISSIDQVWTIWDNGNIYRVNGLTNTAIGTLSAPVSTLFVDIKQVSPTKVWCFRSDGSIYEVDIATATYTASPVLTVTGAGAFALTYRNHIKYFENYNRVVWISSGIVNWIAPTTYTVTAQNVSDYTFTTGNVANANWGDVYFMGLSQSIGTGMVILDLSIINQTSLVFSGKTPFARTSITGCFWSFLLNSFIILGAPANSGAVYFMGVKLTGETFDIHSNQRFNLNTAGAFFCEKFGDYYYFNISASALAVLKESF